LAKSTGDHTDELGADDDDNSLDISRLESLRTELRGKWAKCGDYAKYQIAQRLRAEMANWPGGTEALGEALWVMLRRQQYPARDYDSDAEVARSMAYLILELDPKRAPVVAWAMAAIADADADDTAKILMESGGFDKLAKMAKVDAGKAKARPGKAAKAKAKKAPAKATVLTRGAGTRRSGPR
jgi:hypothetical protein